MASVLSLPRNNVNCQSTLHQTEPRRWSTSLHSRANMRCVHTIILIILCLAAVFASPNQRPALYRRASPPSSPPRSPQHHSTGMLEDIVAQATKRPASSSAGSHGDASHARKRPATHPGQSSQAHPGQSAQSHLAHSMLYTQAHSGHPIQSHQAHTLHSVQPTQAHSTRPMQSTQAHSLHPMQSMQGHSARPTHLTQAHSLHPLQPMHSTETPSAHRQPNLAPSRARTPTPASEGFPLRRTRPVGRPRGSTNKPPPGLDLTHAGGSPSKSPSPPKQPKPPKPKSDRPAPVQWWKIPGGKPKAVHGTGQHYEKGVRNRERNKLKQRIAQAQAELQAKKPGKPDEHPSSNHPPHGGGGPGSPGAGTQAVSKRQAGEEYAYP